MADKKGVQFSEDTARRLVGMLHDFERRKRRPKTTRRLPKMGGYVAVLRYKLLEDFLGDGDAQAVLTYQDADDGSWTDGEPADGDDPKDEETIYDPGLIGSGKKLETDWIIFVYRNPASGLLNLLQADRCAVSA